MSGRSSSQVTISAGSPTSAAFSRVARSMAGQTSPGTSPVPALMRAFHIDGALAETPMAAARIEKLPSAEAARSR